MQAVKFISTISTLALATFATACDSSRGTSPESMHSHSGAPRIVPVSTVYDSELGNSVHAVTSRFNSEVVAAKAGYGVASPCVASPAGTMGFHWVNGALVDNQFDPYNPEAVLYVPDEKGKLRLVAVEYIVVNTGQTAPTFAGQPFDVGGAPLLVAHWTLHVWLYANNPSGLFAPFNPSLACPA